MSDPTSKVKCTCPWSCMTCGACPEHEGCAHVVHTGDKGQEVSEPTIDEMKAAVRERYPHAEAVTVPLNGWRIWGSIEYGFEIGLISTEQEAWADAYSKLPTRLSAVTDERVPQPAPIAPSGDQWDGLYEAAKECAARNRYVNIVGSELIRLIDAARSRESRWVDVRERLPEAVSGEELHTYTNAVLVVEEGTQDQYVAVLWRCGGVVRAWEIEGDSKIEVTHWQPLPAPPMPAEEKEM